MRYESSIVVNRPIEDAWAFTTDIFSILRLGGWALGARLTSPGPIRVGTTIQLRVVILGVEARISCVVTEWDPPHASAFSMTGAGIRSGLLRVTLDSTATGTKIVPMGEIVPRRAFKPVWWITGPFLKRGWDARARKAKALLEAAGS